jgi:hypothetical protein
MRKIRNAALVLLALTIWGTSAYAKARKPDMTCTGGSDDCQCICSDPDLCKSNNGSCDATAQGACLVCSGYPEDGYEIYSCTDHTIEICCDGRADGGPPIVN